MDDSNTVQQRRRALTFIGLVTVCLRSTVQLMSAIVNATGKPDTARWNEAEETAFLDFLIEHKAEAGDGGIPKAATFNAAAVAIAPLRIGGAPKTGKMCRTKFNGAS